MNRNRTARVDDLFHQACAMAGPKRRAFLESACAGDAPLLAEVERLIAHDERPIAFIDEAERGGAAALLAVDLAHDVPAAGSEETGEPLPESIGTYRIIRLIGRGGMGIVYEAQQPNPRRTVALKVLNPGIASRGALRRFEHEAQVLGRLQHPGIAQILEAGTFDSGAGAQPFFAMELVRGEPLLAYAKRRELDMRPRLELVARICDAVEHAHQRGVIHRDLKPSNILVEETTERRRDEATKGVQLGQPKILDFGVARATDADIQTVTLQTGVGDLVGTVPYMSPEQAAGDPADLDTRSDVYALGVIAYELLTGRLPYDVGDKLVHEALRAIREDEPVPLSSVRRALRGDVETIVRKALEKEKSRRYQSAADLAADIRRSLDDEPVLARPPSVAYQLGKFARRNKALVAGAATGFLLMLAGTGISLWQASVAHRARDAADLSAAGAERRARQATIAAAAAGIENGDPQAAQRRLGEVPEAHRHWEWRHLWARLDGSMALLEAVGPFVGAALGADGTQVIIVSRRGLVQSWDPLRAELRGTVALEAGDETLVAAFNRDLTRLITVQGPEGRRVTVWDAATGAPIGRQTEAQEPVGLVAIAPDGRRAAAVRARGYVDLWDVGGNPAVRRIDIGDRVTGLEFGAGGTTLLVADPGGEGGFRVYDAATGETLSSVRLASPLTSLGVAMSPDGRRIAARGYEAKVRIADGRTGELLMDLAGHTGAVHTLAFSPDGARLVTAGLDGTRRLWDLDAGRAVTLYTTPEGPAGTTIEFSGDGTRFATCSRPGEVRLFDATGDDSPVVLRGHGSYVYAVTFSADGRRIISGSWDGTIRVWDAGGGELVATIPAGDGVVTAIAVSLDGRLIASAHHHGELEDSALRLWEADTGLLVRELPSLRGEPLAIGFSPDGTRVACARRYAVVSIQSVATGEPAAAPDAAAGPAQSVAWSPDGALLATGHAGGTIRIRDAASGRELRALDGHTAEVWRLRFSPDGRRLASASGDATARLWDTTGGACRAVLRRHWDEVFSLAFSPDGTRLATGSRDSTISIWDTDSGDELMQLRGHGDYVYDLAFSPGGSMLASASGDGTIRIWDTRPLHERFRNRATMESLRAQMTPRVRELLAAAPDPAAAAAALRSAPDLDAQAREAALQALLRLCQEDPGALQVLEPAAPRQAVPPR